MATIAEVKKKIAEKQKALQKNMKEVEILEESLKNAATNQKKALEKAKTAKNDKKQEYEEEAEELGQEASKFHKKILVLQDATKQFKLTIAKLEEELEELEKGVEKFGKARSDYLIWYAREKKGLATALMQLNALVDKAIEVAEQAEGDVDEGRVEDSREHAKEAAMFLAEAKQFFKRVDSIITEWGNGEWKTQRNLAPKAFGVETVDVKAHDNVTKQVYATFNESDELRREARERIEEAETAVDEAQDLAEAGGKTAAVYEKILIKAQEKLKTKISLYEDILGRVWGKAIAQEGQRFDEEANNIKPGDTVTLNIAAKIVEQARSLVPKQLLILRALLKQTNTMVTRETEKVPVGFQEEFKVKQELKKLRSLMLSLVQMHQVTEKKYPKAIERLDALAKKAGVD